MAKAKLRPPNEVLESISKQAANVKGAAAALTERIEHFQGYLGTIPGRVETTYFGTNPGAENEEEKALTSLAIKLHREGKNWILSWGYHDDRHDDQPVSFHPLVDAPLKIKVAAVKMFPNILTAIEESQTKLVATLIEAVNDYDHFIASLPNKDFDIIARDKFGRIIAIQAKGGN